WKKFSIPHLLKFKKESSPKKLILLISENLLNRFSAIPLINTYNLYQHLMDYWSEIMQDDCYLVSSNGWIEAVMPREVVKVKNTNGKLAWPKEDFDYLKGKRRFKSYLLPKKILINEYFLSEHKNITSIEKNLSDLQLSIQDMINENNGEDGLLEDLIEGEDDKQKITLKSIKVRLSEINGDQNFADENDILKKCKDLLDAQVDEKNKLKAVQSDLNNKVEEKYPKLKEEEIKKLVIENKWMTKLSISLHTELNNVLKKLITRMQELAERYETTLPELVNDIEKLSDSVAKHLKKMGHDGIRK
ncbi:MAG: type I restriction endonuclease subunit M, partial [Methylophilaceae bacterium]|nr:type I restriction endonuclease subunit M [Methylophilaceae bacterium]